MRILIFAICITLLCGCASMKSQKLSAGEAPLVVGPAVRTNRTPLDSAMSCYNRKLAVSDKLAGKKLQIAIGEIKDYTGKVSDSEGATVTQGGSLMLFSGLNKLKNAVTVHDRFDTRVTDLELKYIGLKQLGDGRDHEVNGQSVPWFPYFGGSVKKSDYTILGGITELNYNIQSGGAELRINQVGPAARVYTMSVAVDLRLVNTQTLEVVSAISMQKQFTGYEVGFEIFRFFDINNGSDKLFDVNAGNKSQEPLQLGIRAILEESALRLIADATEISYKDCMPPEWGYSEEEETPEPFVTPASAAIPAPLALLAANPPSIGKNATSTLSWSAQNSYECSITPEIGTVQPNGSLVVTPVATTTYKLSCRGEGGKVESSTMVNVVQPPLDSDMDGIPDEFDACPNTPVKTVVDKTGCKFPECERTTLSITFEFNKAEILSSHHDELNAIADKLNKFPKSTIIIEGHTDNIGTEERNMELSLHRAEAVRNYIVNTRGIDAGRIKAEGFGTGRPVDTNETEDGRRNNRRVETVFTCPG